MTHRQSLPELGPETGGLRTRFVVKAAQRDGKDTYHAQLDIINVTDRPVTIAARWLYEHQKGTLLDYVKAFGRIETNPQIYAGRVFQQMAPNRSSAQPQYELGPHESLSVTWSSADAQIRDLLFPEGLYVWHAVVSVQTQQGEVLSLVSNEQQVPVGGSRERPKSVYGRLLQFDKDKMTARVNLGSNHRIEVGDRFLILAGKGWYWHLNITSVSESESEGKLKVVWIGATPPLDPNPPFPNVGTGVELIPSDHWSDRKQVAQPPPAN